MLKMLSYTESNQMCLHAQIKGNDSQRVNLCNSCESCEELMRKPANSLAYRTGISTLRQ